MSLSQYAFRFYNDNGGEATSTPFAAENANISWPLDTNIVLRLGLTHDGSAAPSTSKYMLFAAPVGTEAWFEVSPTGAGKLRIAQSGGSPNNIPAGGVATTNRLSAPNVSPSPTFVAGRIWDDQSGSDNVALGNGQVTEVGWCLRSIAANGAQNGDVYKFRLLRIPAAAGITPLAIDNTASAKDEDFGTTSQLTMTVGTLTHPGALVLILWANDDGVPRTISSMKLDASTNLTLVGVEPFHQQAGRPEMGGAIYSIVGAPLTAGSHNFDLTMSGTTRWIGMWAISAANVDQTTPTAGFVFDHTDFTTPNALSPAGGTTSDLLFMAQMDFDGGGADTITMSSGTTQVGTQLDDANTFGMNAVAGRAAGNASSLGFAWSATIQCQLSVACVLKAG